MSRRMIVLTEGYSDPVTAKTGTSVIRYRRNEVVAVLDKHHLGKTADQLFGVGDQLPVIASVGQVNGADTLLIGTAPTGGRMPEAWRGIIADAIRHGLNIVSGLHDFVSDDQQFQQLAAQHGTQLIDVRKNDEKGVSGGLPLGDVPLRIHTVGNDCGVGKMVTAIELDLELQRRGLRSKFLATGQTGIMIAGEGVPIDCVVADFVSGAAERLVQGADQQDVVIVEGQGSLTHPMYSAVTLGLLHGCQPHGMILCYEAGRIECGGIAGRKLLPPEGIIELYESMARLIQPASVIGISMNGRRLTPQQADDEKRRLCDATGLPVCDCLRDGPEVLADAVAALKVRQEGNRGS